jgi:hypothetical protein
VGTWAEIRMLNMQALTSNQSVSQPAESNQRRRRRKMAGMRPSVLATAIISSFGGTQMIEQLSMTHPLR